MEKRILLQGAPVDILTFDDALNRAKEAIDNLKNLQVVTINPEMIQYSKKNKDFLNLLNTAELVVADGIGVKIAIKFKGINQERIGGVDYARKLIEMCAKDGYKLALVGAKDEVLNKMLEKLKVEFPNLNIVYTCNGFFEDENRVLNELKNASPQVVLCALGSPKQEFFIQKLKTMLSGCVYVGVGGSFDVWAGCVERAPIFWQKIGFEWLWRTIKQPERIKRIFPALPIFLFESIIDGIKR